LIFKLQESIICFQDLEDKGLQNKTVMSMGKKKIVEILYGLHFGFCFPPDAATTTTEQEMQEEDDDAARRRGSKNKLKRQHRMYDFELEWGYSRHSYEKTVAQMPC